LTELAQEDQSPDTSTATEAPAAPALYRHTKRPEWGLAVVAWQRDGKRGYQFEDGELRVFTRQFFTLLEEVDRPADRAAATIASLQRLLGVSEERRGGGSAERIVPQRPSFEDQLEIFRQEFPAGFDDEEWLQHMRGKGAQRHLKRHRNAVIEQAQRELAKEQLAELSERPEEITDRLVAVLTNTDLLTAAELKLFTKLSPNGKQQLGTALVELLHGDGGYELRFERFVAALDAALPKNKQPSWQLATLPMALFDPKNHVCVRPSGFKEQARWMAPRLTFTKTPNAPTYGRILDMAMAVKAELESSGDPAKDMLDVHDFIKTSLRPSAVKKYIEATPEKSLRAQRSAPAEAA
jgi:hypothetical protein